LRQGLSRQGYGSFLIAVQHSQSHFIKWLIHISSSGQRPFRYTDCSSTLSTTSSYPDPHLDWGKILL
jgi:hypothetical protein